MLLRTCSVYTAATVSAPLLASNTIISTTSSHTSRLQSKKQVAGRRYASIDESARRGSQSENDMQHSWPEPPKGYTCPTPYQIFSMSRTDRYSKAQFYHLVKLYHPDRGEYSTLKSSIPHHVRLERYRLIVAAHNILSDPSKRSAYDRLGMGWHGRPEMKDSSKAGPFSPNWQERDFADSIWPNATWEDWEKFHARNDARAQGTEEQPQAPVYLSNSTFISLVFVIVFAGSAMNYGRAQDNGQYFVEQRDLMHDRAAKELRRVRTGREEGREERLQWFMRKRDATLGLTSEGEVTAMRNELAERVLPKQDVCRGEEVLRDDSLEGD